MHQLRSSVGRRGIGVLVVRVAAFSAALLGITGIVVADVTAAEPEAPAMLPRGDDLEIGADERAPMLLAAAVVVPDAVVPAALELSDMLDLELEQPEPSKKKKRRGSKLKFGRFEGY